MIFIKKHASEQGLILAMCDEELIGRVLKSGKVYIDLKTYADFYKGELLGEEEASSEVGREEIYSANVVGERSVAVMVKNGFVGKQEIKRVEKVPYVQLFKMDF